MNSATLLLPDLTNPLLAPHWEAAARHELAIPFCAQCGSAQWPPRTNCLRCHEFDVEWREVSSEGDLFSYFVAHTALHPSFAEEVPYATGVVHLQANIKMLGRLIEVDHADIEIGMRMEAQFVERAPGVTLVYWRPASSGG